MSLEKMIYSGKVFKLGHHVNTDVLHPSEFFSMNQDIVKKGFLHEMSLNFNNESIILIGGKNMGCGSSRETTAYSLKSNNIEIIIAISFSRIFYRNLVNNGIVPIELPEIYSDIKTNDDIIIDLSQNIILTKNKCWTIPMFDSYIDSILRSGGMVQYLHNKK